MFRQSAATVLQNDRRNKTPNPRHHSRSPGLIVEERQDLPRIRYEKSGNFDLTNAKVVAYAPSEEIGVKDADYKPPHVTFVPADTELKTSRLEKRDTVLCRDARSKSEYIKSMINDPKTPKKNRGRLSVYQSKQRILQGAPIVHEGYDEFLTRLKRGDRPRSSIVRGAFRGRATNFEKRPAVFAAEKIIAGETTVQKSPKKRYVSADPCTLGMSKNQMNKRSAKLIKFPIKQQACITKIEKTCFEQNLQPIIKQSRKSRQIQGSPLVSRYEHTPPKSITTEMSTAKPFSIQRISPERVNVQEVKPSQCHVTFNYGQSQPEMVNQNAKPSHRVVSQVSSISTMPVSTNSQTPKKPPLPNIPCPKQQRPAAPKKQVKPSNDNYSSSEEILKIIEQSRRYRTNASSSTSLQQMTNSNIMRLPQHQQAQQADRSLQHDKSTPNMSSSDDYSYLRPENLFEPKPTETSYANPNTYLAKYNMQQNFPAMASVLHAFDKKPVVATMSAHTDINITFGNNFNGQIVQNRQQFSGNNHTEMTFTSKKEVVTVGRSADKFNTPIMDLADFRQNMQQQMGEFGHRNTDDHYEQLRKQLLEKYRVHPPDNHNSLEQKLPSVVSNHSSHHNNL